jgi:hypothetical protein
MPFDGRIPSTQVRIAVNRNPQITAIPDAQTDFPSLDHTAPHGQVDSVEIAVQDNHAPPRQVYCSGFLANSRTPALRNIVTLRQADATGWQQETLDNHAMAGIRRE